MKREANFTTMFRHWLRKTKMMGVFELKQTTNTSISFKAVEEHQVDALQAAQYGHLVHKISDESRGHKPFDIFSLTHVPAYVVIKYPDRFCIITIRDFLDERESSKRKSLTDWRAEEISFNTVYP